MECKRQWCDKELNIKGENDKQPPDKRELLTSGQNKQQLIQLLFSILKRDCTAPKFQGREVILIYDGKKLSWTFQIALIPLQVQLSH